MKKKLSKDQQKLANLENEVIELKSHIVSLDEEKKRVLADYQNLVRRTQSDRIKLVKLANEGLITSLVQPLQHLEMAAGQISDPGLEMVVDQFKQNLAEFGLEEIEAMGQEFNLETMEVVEMSETKGKKVIKVSQKGYKLNGEVIQHAKVVLG